VNRFRVVQLRFTLRNPREAAEEGNGRSRGLLSAPLLSKPSRRSCSTGPLAAELSNDSGSCGYARPTYAPGLEVISSSWNPSNHLAISSDTTTSTASACGHYRFTCFRRQLLTVSHRVDHNGWDLRQTTSLQSTGDRYVLESRFLPLETLRLPVLTPVRVKAKMTAIAPSLLYIQGDFQVGHPASWALDSPSRVGNVLCAEPHLGWPNSTILVDQLALLRPTLRYTHSVCPARKRPCALGCFRDQAASARCSGFFRILACTTFLSPLRNVCGQTPGCFTVFVTRPKRCLQVPYHAWTVYYLASGLSAPLFADLPISPPVHP
jgi:hypothetical protein